MKSRQYPGREKAILGSLLGLIAGDVMGMPVEFLDSGQIQDQFGWLDRFETPRDGHFHYGMRAGQVTDDSGQALAIANAAITHGGALTVANVSKALLAWAESLGPNLDQVVGPSTKRALKLLQDGLAPEVSGREGKTNGAAMRAPVAGLLHPENLLASLDCAYIVSLPTHGTSVALAGAGAVACAVSMALSPRATLEDLLQAGQEGARLGAQMGKRVWGTPLSSRIELACKLVRQAENEQVALDAICNYVGVDLLVAESVAAAFGIVLLAEGDPVRAIVLAANLGGDTDTIGSIAGAVCGAWLGAGAFPGDWLGFLETTNHLALDVTAAKLTKIIDSKS